MIEPHGITVESLAENLELSTAECYKLSRAAHRLYRTSLHPKPSGGTRVIEAPFPRLKAVQRALSEKILNKIPVHSCFHGRPGTSQLSAARIHVRQPMLITMDVKDFFPSVTARMVGSALLKLDFQLPVIEEMVRLCTRKRRLPQGALTSPVLARIVLSPILLEIEVLFANISPHCKVTQFVDDLAFSGPSGIQRLIPTIHRLWTRHGFEVHPKKTKVMRADESQEVLGVWVNNGLAPTAEFLQRVEEARRTLPLDDQKRLGLENWLSEIQRK